MGATFHGVPLQMKPFIESLKWVFIFGTLAYCGYWLWYVGPPKPKKLSYAEYVAYEDAWRDRIHDPVLIDQYDRAERNGHEWRFRTQGKPAGCFHEECGCEVTCSCTEKDCCCQ